MKILIFNTPEEAAARVAAQITTTVQQNPAARLGLATGGTMPPVYRHLVQAHGRGEVSFARAVSFNLDEYVGLPATHPCSYHSFMQAELFGQADFAPQNTHLPHGDAPDPAAESLRYEALIADKGGIDLQLLGIGPNGHIGFNEPSSSLASRTRVKTLTQTTLQANQTYFDQGEQPPRYAITMGIGTILEARAVVLLATGAGKAQAVAEMIEGPLTAACPASSLQMHPQVTVVLDQAAAAALKHRDYYHTVHPEGREDAA